MSRKIAFIRLLTTCNAHCQMCSVWKRKKEELSLKKLFSMLKTLKKNGFNRVIFTGGEPTLYSKFKELNKFLEKEKIDFGLISNASKINEKSWKKLFPYKNPTGLILSLDSVDGKYHESMRGIEKLSKKVFSAVNVATKEGVFISINTVITKKNYKFLFDFLEYPFFRAVGEWHWIPVKFNDEFALNEKEWVELKEIYSKIKQKISESNFKVKLITTFDFEENTKSFSLLEKQDFTSNYYSCNNCSIAKKMVFIEMNGNVFRCNSFDDSLQKDVLFGNLNETDLNSIISSTENKLILKSPKCMNCDPRNQMFNKRGVWIECWSD